MNVTRTNYYLITGTDRAGEVSNLMNTLKQNNIDLEAMWAYGTPSGRAEMYVIPKNPSQFHNAAAKIGLSYTEGICFKMLASDELGSLASTFNTIARQEISISAMNATAVGGQVGGYIWCRADDVERLGRALGV